MREALLGMVPPPMIADAIAGVSTAAVSLQLHLGYRDGPAPRCGATTTGIHIYTIVHLDSPVSTLLYSKDAFFSYTLS